jgi:hypothetical protein
VVKDGQERIYCQDEIVRDTAVAQLKATSNRKVEVQRNKGLGEMDADDFCGLFPGSSLESYIWYSSRRCPGLSPSNADGMARSLTL